MTKPRAIVIGAGFTGCALAHDLVLRNFDVTVIERGDIANGTSGRTHGLLHSGGRYCVNDPESAIECIQENQILRKIATQCIEPNGGLFVAVDEHDLAYRDKFIKGAEACHIPYEEITPKKALEMEPHLNPKLITAIWVPDGSFEPLRLAMAFAASAKVRGAKFLLYHDVTNITLNNNRNVTGIEAWDRNRKLKINIPADIIINACGAWSGQVAALAKAKVAIRPAPGIMVAFIPRLVDRTINRLIPPDDGDIILPQRRMVIVGTTSYEIDNPDYVPIVKEQIQMMIDRGSLMVPEIARAEIRGTYASTRPLVGGGESGRTISRTFRCVDHLDNDGIDGLVTIAGGKATTCRLMAAATVDLVCQKLRIQAECMTKELVLNSYRDFYLP